MSDKALETIEQRTVEFYGDELIAVRSKDDRIYVSVRHLCDALDLDRPSQVRRIRRHKVLAKGYQRGVILTPHRGQQQAGLIRVDLVPLWLAGLQVSSVKEELRDRLERYQEEAAAVLWEAFQEGRLTADSTFDELLQVDSEAVQAYKMLQAMLRLARNQILLEARLDKHEVQLVNVEERLERVESTLGDPGRHVTPEQASQISQAVKAVAMQLSKTSGRNEYGGVYGELYRKFGITSYKLLPAGRFEEAMKWLSDWYSSLTDQAIPF